MKCPRCGLEVTDQVPRCRGCGFGLADLDRRLGRPPAREGLVNDYAGVLEAAERTALAARLAELQQQLQGEIVLVSVPATRPVKPSEYVFWLFNRWNIGGDSHAGVLLLLAMRERRIESEVGYAWEDFLSDAESGEVLDECVVPLLKEGRVAEALARGVERIAAIVQQGLAAQAATPGTGGSASESEGGE